MGLKESEIIDAAMSSMLFTAFPVTLEVSGTWAAAIAGIKMIIKINALTGFSLIIILTELYSFAVINQVENNENILCGECLHKFYSRVVIKTIVIYHFSVLYIPCNML